MLFSANLIIKRAPLLAGVLFVLVNASCGGNDTPNAAAVPAKPGQSASVNSAGKVSVGNQSWQFAATMQCSVYNSDTVSIAGSAVSDSDIEIVFDVFASDQAALQVRVGDKEWSGNADQFQVSVEDKSVSGTATVTEIMSGDTAAAAFVFNCR
ncbi:MAG: hypothetical protein WBM80_07155 [Woeseiaceae bacterium]